MHAFRATVAALAAATLGCGSDAAAPPPPVDVVVGSFNFAESVLLAETYAQALLDEGLSVRRELDLGARELVQPAMRAGLLDFVPEYLGTALTFVTLGEVEPSTDTAAAWAELRAALEPLGLTALHPAPGEDQNAFVVTAATAAELGLANVSDLAPLAASLVLGGPPECPDRPYCLAGLERVYGLEFGSFVPLDAGGPRTVGALLAGDVDVGVLFSTDANLAGDAFLPLVDDRGLQPAENIVPVVRTAVLQAHSAAIDAAAARVTGVLTTDALIEMNAAFEGGAPIADIAAAFLAGESVLPPGS